MDSFDDLQQLWQGAPPEPFPSAREIIALVRKQRRKMIWTLAAGITSLAATLPVMAWIFVSYQPVYATTRFSIALCALVIVAAIILQSGALTALAGPLHEDLDNRKMIAALQRIKARQRWMNTTFISAYFGLLGVAMALYLFEFVRGNILFGVTAYTLTFGWIAFAWFYLRPRGIKKQNAALDAMISHLDTLQRDWDA